MVKRDNHYEAAFEAYLRALHVPYVAVDELRRSLTADGESIKNLDFLVSSPVGGSWLIDVKGRRFPSGEDQRHYWKNWSTGDDLRSLARWETLFGPSFVGLLVFAFNIVGDQSPLPVERLFEYREALYGFVAVRLADYETAARPISPAWDTVAVPTAEFRRLARPVDEFLRSG
ncbi:MAG TPA: HYExAFE family protein [Thermoguttaceae bacterium]|nr:HYExAFE family protein [Thermoguttaceae bacterium]